MKIKTKILKVDFLCPCEKNKSLFKFFEVIVGSPPEKANIECPLKDCKHAIKLDVEHQLFRDSQLFRKDE